MDGSSGEAPSNVATYPRIKRLGKQIDLKQAQTRNSSFGIDHSEKDVIDLLQYGFQPNQEARISFRDGDSLEVTVLQERSTPGARLEAPLSITRGSYILSIVGFAESDSTFFPWAMSSEKVRLTPTVHLPTKMGTVEVQFDVEKDDEIHIGILSHNQKIGDKCHIHSLVLKQNSRESVSESKGSFKLIHFEDLVPHHNTRLEDTSDGIFVTSEPISTPGAYAIIDVNPNTIISIRLRVSLRFPSIAFLYAADCKDGREITKRNNIFESYEGEDDGYANDFYTSLKIPDGVRKIRLGMLFSTVTKPTSHQMQIMRFEVVEHRRLGDVVDECYVINLDKDSEKLAFSNAQASRFDFHLTRWTGVEGASEPHMSNWQEYMEKPWNEIDEKLNRKAIDKVGAWGYLLSMKGIFEDALLKNHDSIAVFDDDFILSNSFDHRFSKFIEVIDDDFEVAYLGASQWLWDETTQPDADYYHPDGNTNGTFAVIYRRKTFRQILMEIEKMESPFDAGPLRNTVLGPSFGKSFVSYPNMAIANLEKPGIRDSRNQVDFSKRFGWDLEEFPSWFSSWSSRPVVLRDSGIENLSNRPLFITAVTTVNRKEYLIQFLSSWQDTRTNNFDTMLIIADDGSTDGTIDWLLDEANLAQSRVVVIRNNSTGIARQSNSVLDYVSKLDNDTKAIFMCNDDIRFLESGWDESYFDAMLDSGYDHLVYFNSDWKEPTREEKCKKSDLLTSYCTPRQAMGCFYTLTPRLIDTLGYFDEDSFPVRGHSHVDYTMRACRTGANDVESLFDIQNSRALIGMVLRDGYRRTNRTLSVKERMLISSDEELAERESILQTNGRVFVPRGW